MFPQEFRLGHRWRFRVEHLLVAAAVLACCLFFSLLFPVRYLNNFFYDSLLQVRAESRHSEILIVAIDEHSLRELGRWPWDRAYHAELLDVLTEGRARQVLLDILISEEDVSNPASDQKLAEAMVRHGAVYLPVHMEQLRTGGQLIELMPFEALMRASAGLGHVDLDLGDDGIVRSFFLRSGVGEPWWPHVALTMLQEQKPSLAEEYPLPESTLHNSLANVRAYHRFIDFAGPTGSYPQVSYVDVLRQRVPPSILANRVVMVGATAAGMGDLFPVPMSSGGIMMSGVEINANIYDGLQQDQLIQEVPEWMALSISLLVVLLAVLMLPFLAPIWSFPMIGAAALLALLLSHLLLAFGNYWWPPAAAMLSILFALPVWTWRRLEYSLDFLKSALGGIAEYGDLKRRLSEADSVTGLAKLADELLPIEGWSLESLSGKTLLVGGDRRYLLSTTDASVAHYYFRREEDEYRMVVKWQSSNPPAEYVQWLLAALRRVQKPAPRGQAAYEVVESYIDNAREEEARQTALTRFFRSSFSQLQDGVLIADACGNILFANDKALSWFDVSEQDLPAVHLLDIGRALEINSANLSSWQEMLREAILAGSVQLECRDQEKRELYLGVVAVDTGGQPGQVLIVTLKDISEVKKALRIRSEMLDFMSHDLRSPMISILALLETRRTTGETPEEFSELLNQIQFHAEKNLRIAEQFLQLARVESVEQLDLTLLDMLPVVESAIDQVQPQARSREMQIRFHYQEDDSLWVQGNDELLERLLENLLTNAVKYGARGTEIQVRLYCSGSSVVCEVEDQGEGIPADLQQRIFERYQRGSAGSGTRGAGLGLRFVREVAERHGGTVDVRSRLGAGSCFTLTLPAMDEPGSDQPL